MSRHLTFRQFLHFITLLAFFCLTNQGLAGDLKIGVKEVDPDQPPKQIDPLKVQRYLAASYDFESGAQGWTTTDFSGGNIEVPAFHVEDFLGLNGGAAGGLTPISGPKSLWCGIRDVKFHGGAGYGDSWYQVFTTIEFDPTGDVTLDYQIKYDMEDGWDFLYVQFLNNAGEWERIATYTGYSDVFQAHHVIPESSLGATTRLAFLFQSDNLGSDESDWLSVFDSDGAAIIDNLVVADHGGSTVLYTEGFDEEVQDATQTLDGFWFAQNGGRRGDFAALYQAEEVLQEDPNNFNTGHYWGFFDDPAQTNYACGGHPEQGAVAYWNEWECGVQNAIVSPVIDLFTDVDGNPLSYEATGTRVVFDVYLNLPLDAAVFYHWRVRTFENDQWTDWKGDNYVWSGELNRWVTRALDLSFLVGPEATAAQFALVCWDYKGILPLSGDCHTQGPLFDNIQVERYDPEGPRWENVDRFADVFQIGPLRHGAENARILIDEQQPYPEVTVLDALTFRVQPAYPAGGIGFEDSGAPMVYAYVAVTRGDLDYDPEYRTGIDLQSDDRTAENDWKYRFLTTETAGGQAWFVFRAWQGDDPDDPYDNYMDPPAFHFDLNDFTGSDTEDPFWSRGDVVRYFFKATDDLGRTSYFSHNLPETTADIEEAAANPSEFSFLPSWEVDAEGNPVDSCENRVLLVQSSSNLETKVLYENALTELGWCWDRFDNVAAGGGLDLALGGDVSATLCNYKAIIYNRALVEKGNWLTENYPISDYRILFTFLDYFQYLDPTGDSRTGVYLAGSYMASDWDHAEAQQLNDNYFGFNLESQDQTDLGLPVYPRVMSTDDWSTSSYALGLVSGAGYGVLSSPSGGMTYSGETDYKALVWKNNPTARTTGVISAFGLESIEGEGAAVYHLGKTLEKITGVPFDTPQVSVRISTVPEGISLMVDDQLLQTPANLYWEEGSDHTLILSGIEAGDGSLCQFLEWEDGQQAFFREINVPLGSSDLEFTANFIGARRVVDDDLTDLGETSGMAWGDIDGDGLQDLYLARALQPDLLLRNLGDGQFDPVPGTILNHGLGSQGATWADYDNDGDQDLYLVTEAENHLYRNDGMGSFTDVTAGDLGNTDNGRAAAWADFDQDGDLDLYVTNFEGPNCLLRNDGLGGFTVFTSGQLDDAGPGMAGIWADYNNDGYPDLYLVNDGQPNYLLRNDGGLGFTDVTSGALAGPVTSKGAAWGDFDNDGDPDLFLANHLAGVTLLRNDGADTFEDATSATGTSAIFVTGAAWCDYDNDGLLDQYRTTVLAPNSLALAFEDAGQITFLDRTPPPLGYPGSDFYSIRESAWADINGDGYLDVLLSESSTDYPDTRLVLNAGQLGNHWLQLDLRGTQANRDAVGARVEVVTASGSQYRQLYPSSGGAQNSRILHFGLGEDGFVQTVNIRWPGGGTQSLTGVAADQLLSVVQESSIPANTEEGTDVTVQPVVEDTGTTPVTFTFDQVTTAGSTTVTVAEYTAPPPLSYQVGVPPLVYYLETTATYVGAINLCFDYSGTVFDGLEQDIRVFHFNVDSDGDGTADSWSNPIPPNFHDIVNDIICISVTDLSPFAIFTPEYGAISGQVSSSCGESTALLPGVTVDVYSVTTGDLMLETSTDENGEFALDVLPAGEYNLTIVAPIGYVPLAGEIPVTVTNDQPTIVDFTLECVNPNGEPRGTGYWKHQVGVALGGNGNADITGDELCGHLDNIAEHFNNNALNQVVVYQPEGLTECAEKLEMAKSLLNLRGQQEMIARARQHFMATLLNVAAGNLLLFTEVSEDGATLSQAITYCDYLIDDPDGDHELAKDIAETINKGLLVTAGAIPLNTENIAYRISNTPQPFALKASRPNPFNPSTTIGFSIPRTDQVSLAIYGVDGRLVRTLVKEVLPAGGYQIVWNGVDDRGSRVASGVYFYQLIAGEFRDTKKMTLIK